MGIAYDPTKHKTGDAVLYRSEHDPEHSIPPEPGHRRGKILEAFSADQLRGVPILGLGVGGAINGTRPGDSAAELERAGRELVRAHLNRNRFKRAQTSRE